MARVRNWLTGLVALAGLGLACPPAAAETDFATWLERFRQDAAAAGISRHTLDTALAGLSPIARVVELDRKQPEFTQTFWGYMDKRVTAERVARGRSLLAEHAVLLARIQARYDVQPHILVSFWGLESNFGGYTGGFPVVGALATLAFDARRGAFFRAELLNALRILDDGHIAPADMQGSWAGAMGQVQFMPSTFVRYAVDFDGDGRRDIWRSLPDALASAANYLHSLGWRGDERWGREVRLPSDFDWALADPALRKPLSAWQSHGVRRAEGGDLPQADMTATLAVPGGHQGPAFLLYRNFEAILGWNRSQLYAVAVGYLADRIAGAGRLLAARPARDVPLSRHDVEEIQGLLADLGFDPGTADGVIGAQTRAALRAFQRASEMAPDGYPTPEILDALRRAAAQGKPATG